MATFQWSFFVNDNITGLPKSGVNVKVSSDSGVTFLPSALGIDTDILGIANIDIDTIGQYDVYIDGSLSANYNQQSIIPLESNLIPIDSVTGLTDAGVATAYLDATGAYSVPAGEGGVKLDDDNVWTGTNQFSNAAPVIFDNALVSNSIESEDGTNLELKRGTTTKLTLGGVSAIFVNGVDAPDFNGVALTTVGVATNFLNETGTYTAVVTDGLLVLNNAWTGINNYTHTTPITFTNVGGSTLTYDNGTSAFWSISMDDEAFTITDVDGGVEAIFIDNGGIITFDMDLEVNGHEIAGVGNLEVNTIEASPGTDLALSAQSALKLTLSTATAVFEAGVDVIADTFNGVAIADGGTATNFLNEQGNYVAVNTSALLPLNNTWTGENTFGGLEDVFIQNILYTDYISSTTGSDLELQVDNQTAIILGNSTTTLTRPAGTNINLILNPIVDVFPVESQFIFQNNSIQKWSIRESVGSLFFAAGPSGTIDSIELVDDGTVDFAEDVNFTKNVTVSDGASGLPSINFAGATTTGFYRTGADAIRIVFSGSDGPTFTSTSAIFPDISGDAADFDSINVNNSNGIAVLDIRGGGTDATTLATSASEAAFAIQATSAGQESIFMGTDGTGLYIQAANFGGAASFDLLLNPYGGDVQAPTFNGVALTDGGVVTNFLNETGGYSVPPSSGVQLGDSPTWTGTHTFDLELNADGGINSAGDLSLSRNSDEQIRLATSKVSIYKATTFEVGANSMTMLLGGNGGINLQSTGGAPRAEFKVDGSVNSFLLLRNSAGSAQVTLLADGNNSTFVQGVSAATLHSTSMKSGATQVGAGAVADELWKTLSHATLPDNVVLIGV